MPVSVQARFTLASGNAVTIYIEPDGEIEMNYNRPPSKEDKAEADSHIPEAMSEAGERGRDRGESE